MSGRARLLAFVAGIAGAAIALSNAGPLDPPSGPVSVTGPMLLFPTVNTITIASPGAYKIMGDLNTHIDIMADNVCLDLNGFSIHGQGRSGSGITIPNAQSNVTIRNGTIREWNGKGITAPLTSGLKLESVTVRNIGIDAQGHQGVEASSGASMIGCLITSTGTGVVLGLGSTVVDCRIINNASGLLTVGDYSVITGCTSFGNARWQIIAGAHSVVKDCTCSGGAPPTDRGLSVGLGSTVSGCSLEGYFTALSAGDGCTIRSCSIRQSTASAVGTAVTMGTSCKLSDCTLTCGAAGQAGTFVEGCCFNVNPNVDALNVGATSTVRNCSFSGSANAIVTAGTGSLIEDNRVSGATVGISVTGTGNIIVRNSITGGSPAYSIASNNSVGQILNVSNNAAIVAANAAANFQY